MRHPRFNEFKSVVQHRPEVLNQVLGALMQQNPNLITAIAENQEEFVRLLQEPAALPGQGGTPQDAVAAMIAAAQAAQAGGGGGMPPGGMPMGGMPPGAPPGGVPGQPQPEGGQQLQLSASDREAVERLMALGGFPRSDAVQAYLACERNEEVAANYLFDLMS